MEPGWEKQAETMVWQKQVLATCSCRSLPVHSHTHLSGLCSRGRQLRESPLFSSALACFLNAYCVAVSGKYAKLMTIEKN